MHDYRSEYRRRPAAGGPGYDVEFGDWGARSGLDRGPAGGGGYDATWIPGRWSMWDRGYDRGYDRAGFRRDTSARAPYDRGRGRGDYGRGSGGGWGMGGLFDQMMRGRGEGFGYPRDYNRSHPLHPWDRYDMGYAAETPRPPAWYRARRGPWR